MLFYNFKKYKKIICIIFLSISLNIYFGFYLFGNKNGLIYFWKLQKYHNELYIELNQLQNIKNKIYKKLSKLTSKEIDGDYLDELVRRKLGLVGKNDLIILRQDNHFIN